MTRSQQYVYALTRADVPDLDTVEALDGQAPVTLAVHDDIAAVISSAPVEALAALAAPHPAGSRPEHLGVLARRHDAVVRAVHGRAPVLPLRFGTVLDGTEAAVRLLSARHEEASLWLNRVEGRREWGVRVRAAGRAPVDLDGVSGTSYLTQRRGRLAAAENARRGTAAVHQALTRRAAESTCRDLAGDLLLEAAYLVDIGSEEDFHAEVHRLTGEMGLPAEITGPWPPYSFTKVEFADA